MPHFDAGGETDAIFSAEAAPTNELLAALTNLSSKLAA